MAKGQFGECEIVAPAATGYGGAAQVPTLATFSALSLRLPPYLRRFDCHVAAGSSTAAHAGLSLVLRQAGVAGVRDADCVQSTIRGSRASSCSSRAPPFLCRKYSRWPGIAAVHAMLPWSCRVCKSQPLSGL